MEKFKAVEKAMKTKAYSKEGLSAATKLDPKERAKAEACEFLSNMVDELERQIETLEAEGEGIRATMKKGKNHSAKQDRMGEIDRVTERHKWHQGKLELMKRSLENGGIETEQVNDLEESIRYYVTDNATDDFMEDDLMYEDLNLQEEEDVYGMNNENDRVSSQDTQSIQDDTPEPEIRSNSIPGGKSKPASTAEAPSISTRRPSTQMKSPAPALATLHTPLSNITNNAQTAMKPATVPTRVPGETLKYASAAAAAAASDKNNVGIAPLPPPPEALPPPNTSVNHTLLPSNAVRRPSLASPSPKAAYSQPTPITQSSATRPNVPAAIEPSSSSQPKSPVLSQSTDALNGGGLPQASAEKPESTRPDTSRGSSGKGTATLEATDTSKGSFLCHYLMFKY